jgi:arylsulfatase A-like enzyme
MNSEKGKMKNRILFCAIFALVVFAFGPAGRAASPTTKPLNILWLSFEDSSPWFACYGDKTAPTPNIDRLVREGVHYTNAFSTSPVCAPSRNTIITGMYASQTGGLHHRNGKQGKEEGGEGGGGGGRARRAQKFDIPVYEAVPPPEVRCFPEYLRMAGYYATNNVKQDYQFIAPPTVWDESSGKADYSKRAAGQPFFAVYNNTWTHESQVFPDAPHRANVVKPADVPVPPYYPDTPLVRETLAQAYNQIVAFDGWVGEKIDQLEKAGELENTVIFVFSDHGVGLPRGKRNSYDSGLRVPLIVRLPGKERAGETDDRLVSFIDLAPTVLSLVNIQPPAYMKGHPFLGAFKTDPPTYAFATQDRMDGVMDGCRSASDGRFRYILNLMPELPHLPKVAYREKQEIMKDLNHLRDPDGGATPQQWQMVSTHKPREEFYDSKSDPHNVVNLIDAPEHQERIKTMRAAVEKWMTETGDLGLIQPEAKMVKEKLYPPDGVQPTTETPTVSLKPGADGKLLLTIDCSTNGASIGYHRPSDKSWQIYTKPVEVPSGDYEVVAHRIGFKRSEVVAAKP